MAKEFSRRLFLKGAMFTTVGFISREGSAFAVQKVMEKRKLGRTGWKVSVVGFGGGAIGGMRMPDEMAVGILRRAMDRGVNFFDVAPTYGRSEIRLGKAIQGYPRKSFFLATKIESASGEWTAKEATDLIHQSLDRLQVDTIDLIQFHGVGGKEGLRKILSSGGGLEGVRKAQQKGYVRFVGITGGHHPKELEVMVEAIETDEFDTVMPSYNIEFTEAGKEGGVFETADKHRVGVIIKKPFTQQPPLPRWFGGGHRSLIPDYGVEKCMHFVIRTPGVHVVIPGMHAVEHVEQDTACGYTAPIFLP